MTLNPPTNCPACNSELEWRKDILYCVNVLCPAKQAKQVEHFAKSMKIKGLGPATIRDLDLSSILDIYTSDLSKLSSEKIAEKLGAEIDKSKNSPLNKVLPAFGIPLIGQSATQKLSKVCKSIFDIDEETCRQAGLGEKTTNNLLDWLTLNLEEYLSLPFDWTFEEQEVVNERGVVCITGRLTSYKTKADATKDLQNAGWRVASSVTKEVTHLINESGKETAKTKKAAESGIIIVNKVTDIL